MSFLSVCVLFGYSLFSEKESKCTWIWAGGTVEGNLAEWREKMYYMMNLFSINRKNEGNVLVKVHHCVCASNDHSSKEKQENIINLKTMVFYIVFIASLSCTYISF